MEFEKISNGYCVVFEKSVKDKDIVIPDYYKGEKVTKVTIDNYTSFDFDNFTLGDNVELLHVKKTFNRYMKWNKHLTIENLVINEKLQEIILDGECLVTNFINENNPNFELINGYVFQKYDSSIILRLWNTKEPLINDKRIKKLNFETFIYHQVDLYIPENVEEIADKTLYNMYPCNISVHPNNKYFSIINSCLIELDNNSLRKVTNSDVDLSKMTFNRTDGYFFLMTSKEVCIPSTCKIMNNLHVPLFLRFVIETHFKILDDVLFTGDLELHCENIELKVNNVDNTILISNNAVH